SPRGGPRDGFTVFQVEDRSFPSSTVPLNDSACQPCDRGLFDRGHLVEGVPGQLCLVEDDPVHPCPVEHSPVEDEQQSVPLGKGRCPVRDQQTSDRRGDPQLFLHLAYHRLGGCLPVLDVSAGDLQVVLVGRDHHHHSVEVIVEQGTGRGAGTCEGLGGINCHGLRPTLLFFSIVLHGRAFGRSSFLPPLSPAR